jgi:hypothetical protein
VLTRANLFPYQQNAVRFLMEHDNVAAMIKMGLGKSVMSLTAFLDLYYSFEVRRALVIAPLRVARRVWSDEIDRWAHLRGLTVAKIIGTPKERMRALRTPADIHTVNREQVPWLEAQFCQNGKQIMRWPWDIVFNDESQGFKSQSSERYKSLKRLRWGLGKGRVMWPRMVNLSGTPMPNGYRDLWSQFMLLDNGRRLGTDENAYQQRFFLPPEHQYARWRLRDKARDEILSLISDITISIDDDMGDKPRMNYIRVSLPENVLRKYKEMEKKFLTELFSGTKVSAANAGVCMGKLCQLANGAVYTGEGAWEPLHEEKLRALPEVIEAANGPVLLVYSYRPEIERCGRVLDEMGVSWRLLRDDREFDMFRDGELDVGVLHPASAGHGLNDLHLSGSETLIHFGMTANMEWYSQVNARLAGGHRRTGKNVVIHHIIADRTIDDDLVAMMGAKDEEQGAFTELLARRAGRA